ncbi:uncharacterized protein K02A2.6-like [Toxorhynchites rutilus septentrionalis]|uniref:uncharacterized protein K02A2.6-like n=1 Tax=Toxorhynchites rutilus septentrionalis TaxID=329112 RepID=UPI0024799DC8|nr:uncharacterized protein K02A2.6-like [Toxorhynchites rutilus septentrionalis]
MESWPAPEKPWQRLHLDYVGPLDGNYFLVLVDSFTKMARSRTNQGDYHHSNLANPSWHLRKIRSAVQWTRKETLEEAIDTSLLCYRRTPCRSAPCGKSPADLMYGRPIRTSLELLRPPTPFYKLPSTKQEKQFNRKHGAKARSCDSQDLVWAKVYAANK